MNLNYIFTKNEYNIFFQPSQKFFLNFIYKSFLNFPKHNF